VAELAVQPPTGLYPQPPQQQGGLSSNPAQVLDLIGKITQNQMLQNELRAKAAIGEAYQGAMTPDGGVDPQRLRAVLMNNPAASWMMPQALEHVQGLAASQFDLAAKQSNWIADRLGSLAKKPNLSREDIHHFVVDAARDVGVNPTVLVGWRDRVFNHPRGLRDAVQTAASQATGSAGLLGRVEGPPGPGGEKTSVSVGQTVFGQPGQPMPIGQPPGESETQTESAKRASQLQASGATTAQTHADLQNLKDLSKAFAIGGPTAELEIRLAQVGQRLGLPTTLTSKQLAAGEEFNKIANAFSVNQTKGFYGSDAALHAVVGSNPNLSTSALGREGVIDMLAGNQDAIDTLRNEWLKARQQGIPANAHDRWMNDAAKNIDPRLFQFNRLSPQGQRTFWGQLDPTEIPTFKAKYMAAVKNGWVKLPKPAAPGE
jgi:hypothetical protein